LVAALGTKFWIVARARRVSNPEESDGRIHFGLFDGKKELNVAYGWRTYDISGEFDMFVKRSRIKFRRLGSDRLMPVLLSVMSVLI
jgi:hypothetical protein